MPVHCNSESGGDGWRASIGGAACSLSLTRFKEEPVSAFVQIVVVKALWLEAGFFPACAFS